MLKYLLKTKMDAPVRLRASLLVIKIRRQHGPCLSHQASLSDKVVAVAVAVMCIRVVKKKLCRERNPAPCVVVS